jgi:peptidoglycan/LPS O-acetylase OafA/YrhL
VYLIWDRFHPGGGIAGTLAVYGFAQSYYSTASAQMVGQAWTLDIEVAFYILIPLVAMIALASRRRLRTTPAMRLAIVLVVLLAAYVLSLYFKHEIGSPSNVDYNIAQYLFAFIPGVALAAIEPFAAPRLRGTHAGRIWAWGLLALCVALLSVYISVPATDDNPRLILVTLGCGALLAAPLLLQWTTGGCWRVLDNRVIRWLGVRSYGIYLIHLGLMTHVLARFGHGHSVKTTFVLLLVGVLTATLIAAELLWRLVERPALELRLPWRQSEFAGAAEIQPADA